MRDIDWFRELSNGFEFLGISSDAATIASEESGSHLKDIVLEELRSAAIADLEYRRLKDAIENGFPGGPDELEPAMRTFWKLRNELWTDNGLILFGSRIVIPKAKCAEILSRLHAAHAGIERTKRRALVYWPSINSDITNTVGACDKCQQAQASLQKEPMHIEPPPAKVFDDVSADLFEIAGSKYLV